MLLSSPTGSGKTLAAFLWALQQLVSGRWPAGRVRVLYVSPLKALGSDVRINLLKPLTELGRYFEAAGKPFPPVGVLTRSGDTPAGERRAMLRRPPEILITTPESLNILLSSRKSREMLDGIATVILDEIHAVAGNKRGTHLVTAVERLVPLSGEFQRIALSATVKPLATVADFVGGLGPDRAKRPVSIVDSGDAKRFDVRVSLAAPSPGPPEEGGRWPSLAAAFKEIIRSHRSTLLFANSRRTAEKVARLINEGEREDLAYSHHGSLSREIRLAVERRLKMGELRSIVATSSLELGIDVGGLDAVLLIQTPPSVSSALQRIGRSGHAVGEVSRGYVFPTHGADFLSAAVMARCVMDRDIEPVTPVERPLDVLAQVILSMTGVEEWPIDGLYRFITGTYPYRDLPRRHFDLVMDMLSGRYAGTRIRELIPRVTVDRIDGTVRAREGVPRLIYASGGTIPDRGYFDLRVQDSRAKIGELDEEFVWERNVGETFTLGAQVWRIGRITHNDVEVTPAKAAPGIFPFWRAEEIDRGFHLSEKIALFLEDATERLEDPSLARELRETCRMDADAADELVRYLARQREHTRAALPHRHHLLVEHVTESPDAEGRKETIIHTLWGGRVNRPFATALAAALEERHSVVPETVVNNDCVMLILPHDLPAAGLLELVRPEYLQRLLRSRLERGGYFGARFRENAGRALLLPRAGFRRRTPLWLSRLRAKKLLEAVMPFEDFPILLETWRTCLQDEFDLESLGRLLEEVRDGTIAVSEVSVASPSPFAANLSWKRTNTYMYQDDTPPAGRRSALTGDLIAEAASSARLRPRIPARVIAALEEKLRRTAPGYAPGTPGELLDLVLDRVLVPGRELPELDGAAARDGGNTLAGLMGPVAGKLAMVRLPGAMVECLCAMESLPRLARAFERTGGDMQVRPAGDGPPAPVTIRARRAIRSDAPRDAEAADILQEWLSFYGPVDPAFIEEVFGPGEGILREALDALVRDGRVTAGMLSEGSDADEVCDTGNLEILLRMARRARRPSFRALPAEKLPLFLADYQGLTRQGASIGDLRERLEQLFGYPARAGAWEELILPARLSKYSTAWLDSLMQSSDLMWTGCGNKKLTFCFHGERELFHDSPTGPGEALKVVPSAAGRYTFMDCARHSGLPTDELTDRLWGLAWKGLISNDSFHAVRKGALHAFSPHSPGREDPAGYRSAFHRWESTRPMAGNWFVVPVPEAERDPVDEEDLRRERVRQLLRRYGLLFRELLAQELPPLRWQPLFKTLRLMELSGEIVSGHFFEGIPGLQFLSPAAFRVLNRPLPGDAIYWMSAADPASLCGVRLEGLEGLPARRDTTLTVYKGKDLVMVAARGGASLEFRTPPEDPRLAEYLSCFGALTGREFSPRFDIRVDSINGEAAAASAYARALMEYGFDRDYRALTLRKRYPEGPGRTTT